ncbi:hypothetical protein F5148DRAFT_984973 [Russula earlei]|uniref:Uncharacterized protein n=1 Tax=Russula earlei TaxID=71964 RepID=A0ACC0U0W9_9AGAM|nr:hypothetical protein F5148DRAFT_984973 [Russula earlei]
MANTIPSLTVDGSDVYLAEHLATHISATRHHLTGAPDHPEKPYKPSFHPPTGYWSSAEKALFFRALSVHSRFRPDLIAASIGTKSTADVAVYLSLLREGAARTAIARDRHPAAHEVSAALVDFEDRCAAPICAAEPARALEALKMAREEAARSVQNSLRARRGQGDIDGVRDWEGQRVRAEAFRRWREEREVEWAREDLLSRFDSVGLQVLDRMLRLDEAKADPDGEEEERDVRMRRTLSGARPPVAGPSTQHPSTPASSPAIEPHGTTSTALVVSIANDDTEVIADTIPSNLSPASRRRAYKRLYMRRKRAEASGGVAQLDPARLKPGRKASATSKFMRPRSEGEDSKGRRRGHTRQYKIQSMLERHGIGAEYLHTNGLGLFHLGALSRLMRLYPCLDASRPEGVAESIAAETIQMLHALVVQFTRSIVRRAITLRELEFALLSHSKLWRLGKRVVRPPHVRRALELSGAARLSKRTHFEGLLERFSEEGSTDSDDDEDLPLAVRAGMEKALAKMRSSRKPVPAMRLRSGTGLQTIAPCTPRLCTCPTWSHLPIRSASMREEEEEEELMPAETDDEALAVELHEDAKLDEADARAASQYEAGVWRELLGEHGVDMQDTEVPARKRSADEEVGGGDAHSIPPRKRTRQVKSAALIEDSDDD